MDQEIMFPWFTIDDLWKGDSSEDKAFWEKSFPLVDDVIADIENKKHKLGDDAAGIAKLESVIDQLRPYSGKRLVIDVPEGYTFKWTLGEKSD